MENKRYPGHPCAVCLIARVHHSKWASQDKRLAVYRGHGIEDFSSVRIEDLYVDA